MVVIKLIGGTQGHGPLHTHQKDRYILDSHTDILMAALKCSSPMNVHGREMCDKALKMSAFKNRFDF